MADEASAQARGDDLVPCGDLRAARQSPAGAPAARPKDVMRIDCHNATARRDGPWLVPRRIEVHVTSGSVTLDFTGAVTSWPTLQIGAEVRSGNLTRVTRPGILVSTDDLAIRRSSVKLRMPWGPGAPVGFRIDVSGNADNSSITARPPRPPRRTLWQWLRRRPLPDALPPGPAG